MHKISQTSFQTLSKWISLFVLAVGCMVLMGWMLNISSLQSLLPGFPTMKGNTAALFILSGISLWMQVKGQRPRIARAAAILVALIGLLTLGEYIFDRSFGIDQLLFNDLAEGALYPGRMSPATALCFFLIGLVLAFLDARPHDQLNEYLIITVFAICGLALLGYIYGVSSLYKIGVYSSMAVHTALNFIVLSIGVFFARPQRIMIQTMFADTPGGNILRRFLPAAIFVPILLGWISLQGQRAGLYDTYFGLALMVASLILALSVFIWLNAGQLTRMDLKRREIDRNLHESELRFRSTLESMIEGCQIIGYDWRYLYLNDSAVKHSQQTREQLIGHTMMECYPGIENTALFEALHRSMNERVQSHMVNEFIYPDGTKGWFELSVQPAPDGIFILSSDITHRKKAEQAVLEREMKLSVLLDILPVGISILDAEQNVPYTNPALKRILGVSEEGLQSGSYRNRKYLRSDGTLMPLDEMASALALTQNKASGVVETGVVKEDESIVWTQVSAVPVDFPDWKAVIVTSDITERKKIEDDLRNNERRLHLAASAGGVGIWDWDILKDELIWDDSMYFLYGLSKTDFHGAYDAWISTLHPDDRAFTDAEIQAALRGEREYAPQFRVIRPDGTVRVIKATSQTIRDQNGKALRMIGTNIDITEQKKAEEEILKLNTELEFKVIERTAELASANEKLKLLSLFDQLTGLYNRHGFLLLAEAQLSLAKRTRRNLLVFYADLDNLKQINDHNGHMAGDQAIVAAARALEESFRTSDIKARLGGDEFIVLVVEADGGDADALLVRLQERLAENQQSMSVGMVTWNAQMDVSMDDLIAQADQAMYVEKRKKPGRFAA